MEKIQKKFLWGGGGVEKKLHHVKWSIVCIFFLLNKALLCKWNWRYATERGTFWTQVISGKYGEEKGGWWSHEVRDGYGVGLWNPLGRNEILSWIVFLLWWAMGGW